MIAEERVMTLLAESNPVPDIAALDLSEEPPSRHLTDLATSSREMTDLKSNRSGTAPAIGRRRLIVGTAAAAVIVIAAVALRRPTDQVPVGAQTSSVTTTVAEMTGQSTAEDTTIGLSGLPPVGAMPSTPENGELVASMWEHIGAPGSFGNGWLYLYADGRLIWEQSDPNPTGGWLEQRLTPEGVELIRSEIVATGLFEPDQPPPASNNGFPRHVNGGSVQVRNGDELVYVNRVVPELMERLAELWSWLPDSAWEDRDAKAYVPSRYAVCMHENGNVAPNDATDHLSALPAAARDLLAGAGQLHVDALVDIDPAGFAWLEGSTEYCYNLATEEARVLAATLDEAGGIEKLPHREYDGSEMTYLVSVSLEEYNNNPFDAITLTFWPMLPHGVPALTGA